ncbi:MAG: GGDEF domain-containing protein [Syntrophotaleaceae bacterium]
MRLLAVDEPRPPVALVGAMGQPAGEDAEGADGLEILRKEIEHDPLTGLLLREPFLKRTESVLSRDASAAGGLVIARVAKLADINRSLGREATDQLLRRIGEQLSDLCSEKSEWAAGRLGGAVSIAGSRQ